MAHQDKIKPLSSRDRILIDIILIGCTKMITKLIYTKSKKRAAASYNLQTKALALDWIFINLSEIVEQKPEIRPADVRRKLPEGRIRNIQSSDLTHILDFLVNIKVLERLPPNQKVRITKRPGHPMEHVTSAITLSGPNSLYKPSQFYHDIKYILSKPKAIRWIHTLLLESGLLYKYKRYVQLFIFDVIRNKKYDKDTAWKVCKSTFPLCTKEKEDFENYYTITKNISNGNELVKQAEKTALTYVKDHLGEDYTEIFRMGAYYFRLYTD